MRLANIAQTLVGSVVGLLMAGSASAALVTNGTFDSGTSGWTLSQTDSFTWASSEGNPGGSLVLNNGPGPVPQASQIVSGLIVGEMYRVSVDGKTHYNCCNSDFTPGAGVAIDGHQFDFLIHNNQAWTTYTFDFTYSGVSNVLVLSAQRNGTDADGQFDNVSIADLGGSHNMPLPPTLALLAIGAAASSFARRR